MKETLIDLFTSKKFLAALTAIIVYIAGRFGFDVDTAVLDRLFAALLVYVGAQGIADNGKSSAQILSAVRAPVPVPSGLAIAPSPRDSQAGSVTMLNLLAIVMVGGVIGATFIIGCTATQARHAAASGVVSALDCEAANIDAQALADAKVYAEDTVQRWISGTGDKPSADAIKAVLVRIKSDVGKCAIVGALAAATVVVVTPPGTVVSALAVGDPVQLRAAFAVAARQAGWAPVKVAGGAVL